MFPSAAKVHAVRAIVGQHAHSAPCAQFKKACCVSGENNITTCNVIFASTPRKQTQQFCFVVGATSTTTPRAQFKKVCCVSGAACMQCPRRSVYKLCVIVGCSMP
jgi:dTDP-4-dehydrorhamnose 3,5-epimerase-like enzyme